MLSDLLLFLQLAGLLYTAQLAFPSTANKMTSSVSAKTMKTREAIEREERALAIAVNEIRDRLVQQDKLNYIAKYNFKKATWDDPLRHKNGNKLSCWGSNINDSFFVQYLLDGTPYEQFQLCGPNHDSVFVPIPTSKINTLLTDADGNNPRIITEDGGKATFAYQLKNAAQVAGAALADGVTINLGIDDPDVSNIDMCQYKIVVTFTRFEDITDDNTAVEVASKIRSYGSGSGAENVAFLMGGFGTCVKVLQGDKPGVHGSCTTVCPSIDFKGERYEFRLSVTPFVDASGEAVKIEDSSKETKESAMRAAAKGLAVEVPVGPDGAAKITSTLLAIVPIEKIEPPPPPPPELIKTTLYVAIDPLSLAKVYCYARTDRRFVHQPTESVLAQAATAVELSGNYAVYNIIGYTPASKPIELLPIYKTLDPVNERVIYTRKWTDRRYRIVNPSEEELAGLAVLTETDGAPSRFGISGYVAAIATPDQLAEHPEWAPPRNYRCLTRSLGEEEEEDEDFEEPEEAVYRSGGPAASADNEPMDDVVEPVVGDASDSFLPAPAPELSVEGPPDASANAAAAASSSSAPPMVGDKRLWSTSNRDTTATNLTLTRQQRSKKSVGKAPKIHSNVTRSFKNGTIVITEFIHVGLRADKGPTEEDLIQLDTLVGKRLEAAKHAGNVKSVKNLSGAYAEKMGAVTNNKMTPDQKYDINATNAATNVMYAVVDAPIVDMPDGIF
jgi:hypothetical protein